MLHSAWLSSWAPWGTNQYRWYLPLSSCLHFRAFSPWWLPFMYLLALRACVCEPPAPKVLALLSFCPIRCVALWHVDMLNNLDLTLIGLKVANVHLTCLGLLGRSQVFAFFALYEYGRARDRSWWGPNHIQKCGKKPCRNQPCLVDTCHEHRQQGVWIQRILWLQQLGYSILYDLRKTNTAYTLTSGWLSSWPPTQTLNKVGT